MCQSEHFRVSNWTNRRDFCDLWLVIKYDAITSRWVKELPFCRACILHATSWRRFRPDFLASAHGFGAILLLCLCTIRKMTELISLCKTNPDSRYPWKRRSGGYLLIIFSSTSDCLVKMFCNSFLVSQPSHRYPHSQRRRTILEMKNLLLTTATVLIALFQAVAAQGSLDRVLETNEENLDVDIRLFLSSRSSILSSRSSSESESTQSSRSKIVSA